MRLILVLLGVAAAFTSAAQEFNRLQADSLLQLLQATKASAPKVEILTNLAAYHIFKPGENKVDLDSANTLLQEATQLNQSARIPFFEGRLLLIKAIMLREQGNEADGRKAVEQAIPLLEQSTYRYHLGRAYNELGGYYEWQDKDQLRQRIVLTHKAADAFLQAGDIEQQGHALRMLGDLYGVNREFPKALVVLKEAVVAYQAAGHTKLQGVYELMSRASMRVTDYKSAIVYGLLALKVAKAEQDSSLQLATINNSLGNLYRMAGRRETAIRYFRDALGVALHFDETSNVISIAYNIGLCYLDLGQPREAINLLQSIPVHHTSDPHPIGRTWLSTIYMRAYELQGQEDSVLRHRHALERAVVDPVVSQDLKYAAYVVLGRNYFGRQDLPRALHFLRQCDSLEVPPISRPAADRAFLAYKLDSAQGRYREALVNLNLYKSVSDTLFNEVKFRQFQQLEVEYETSRKADSIALLTQKNDLQSASLRVAGLTRDITISGIVLSAVIIGLLYRQYRLKQQSNQVITGKNNKLERLVKEKEWLLKEVHHRVKNNLQTIMSLLEMQSNAVNKDAQSALLTSQNRIFATSLLHQKLYRSDNISSVNIATYLSELIQHIKDALEVERPIAIMKDIVPLELDVTQGVPLGLIVNEVITNTFKYAFNDSIEHPVITVSLTHQDGMAELLIADNGIGFRRKEEESMGLGLELVMGLATDIGATVSIESSQGTSVRLRFKPRLSLHSMVSAGEEYAAV
ncbi:histidine kinase dimerization/phosphoacceptor domain -containing protein [Paraflavitalea pollutisoli]|uniref:histidine kinase dimerization/phosphoacceptor domain -containing protein n=1 Tax=Paraflavitalea pollutisoli TaxID=3034143 RepID=UPI0023ECC70A|nr:histidine kinase dimerization/phosphoacceptor domain -containing protein [Paraflavitalea sp. H1-2-19X]